MLPTGFAAVSLRNPKEVKGMGEEESEWEEEEEEEDWEEEGW